MNFPLLLLLFFSVPVISQSLDYNTKKGFAANGFDVVAYFEGKAVAGNKKFTTTFDGVKYRFSSQEHLESFVANPKKFMPQYGGYCAYAVALKSDKVSINPKTFLVKDGKLYLFYNAWGTNTLELWQKENETELLEKADKNWETVKFKT